MKQDNEKFINREISWLSFNARVLQEAEDPTVPLLERIRFLGIFSNNLDEFFRVRFATVKRTIKLGATSKAIAGGSPKNVLKQIQQIAKDQHSRFNKIYGDILLELQKHGVFKLNEKTIDPEQGEFVKNFFHEKVRPTLTPIMIDSVQKFPKLRDKIVYLAIKLTSKIPGTKVRYALVQVPSHILPRFVVLPQRKGDKFFMMLDDVIRYNLNDLFYIFHYDVAEAFTIKVTLDAELDIDNDISKSIRELISRSIKKREIANPVRFIYDKEMPRDLFEFLVERLKLTQDDNIIAGARYHNFTDFMGFPDLGMKALLYKKTPALFHQSLGQKISIFSALKQKDVLLHFPYHSFNHINDFLREAAIDPKVRTIRITLYRVAEDSTIVNALINALRNGKNVTAVVELQARFDEESNIYWANRLAEAGAKVIYGVKSLKVHCKLCLISRKEDGKSFYYANIGTGNYNEQTARVYSDHSLFTADTKITKEISKIFKFFSNNLERGRFKHLVVAPFSLRAKMLKLITKEIQNAKEGKEAYILLKLNSLVDPDMIKKLYDASKAGVKIRLVIRGVSSLIPGKPGLSENIEAVSIVDKYLEHSRIFIFCNGGDEKYFISSADWMTRNLDHRVEVACPIYDKDIKRELRDFLEIQFQDNVKARMLAGAQENNYRKADNGKQVRAQEEIYKYLKEKLSVKAV